MPNIPSEYSYITQANNLWSKNIDLIGYDGNFTGSTAQYIKMDCRDTLSVTYKSNNFSNARVENNQDFIVVVGYQPIMTIEVDTTTTPISVSYSSADSVGMNPYTPHPYWRFSYLNNLSMFYQEGIDASYFPNLPYVQTSFNTLSDAISYIYTHYANINLFVDGEQWLRDRTQPPIVYNWQSVPSISGKNGILQSLVQIKEEALNDGEPVSEASVTSFDSLGNINIPSVIDEQMPVDPSDVTSVTATYLIPALEDGTYEGIKLLIKKNSIPTSEEDADKLIDLSEPTSILRIDSKSVGNLDEDSHYYFMIKLVDEIGTEATSDPKDIWTSHSEGYNFEYTGEIVEWTAPKTGIYSLETWGAQGGNATDETNSARGGYGAYAYGEVLLTQGEKLYINVGGQNGYGGGGDIYREIVLYDNGTVNSDYLDVTDIVITKTAEASSENRYPLTFTVNQNNLVISHNLPYKYNDMTYNLTFNKFVIPVGYSRIKVTGSLSVYSEGDHSMLNFEFKDSGGSSKGNISLEFKDGQYHYTSKSWEGIGNSDGTFTTINDSESNKVYDVPITNENGKTSAVWVSRVSNNSRYTLTINKIVVSNM